MTGPVLHVISGLRTGGAEGFLVALAGELARRGIEQHVATLTADGPNQPRLEALGIRVTVLDPRTARTGVAGALVRLVRLIRRVRPAVLQGWLYHGDLFAAAAQRLAVQRPRPVLAWGLRNSDIDDGRYGRLLRLCASLSGWPDVAISNSEAGARFHLARGYRPRRLAVIPNGFDTSRFRPDAPVREEVRRELGIPRGAVVAVHSARLDPMKDHPTLLAAAELVPHVTVLLMGAGTETLRTLPPNVRALGRSDRPERIYRCGDIVLSSSAYGEGFSNALAEGMACGLVPIATEVGDARALVGATGRLVPPRDATALAEALAAVAALADPERGALGVAARAWIENEYSLPRAADAFVAAWSGADRGSPG